MQEGNQTRLHDEKVMQPDSQVMIEFVGKLAFIQKLLLNPISQIIFFRCIGLSFALEV